MQDYIAELSAREAEVLDALADRLTNAEIAGRLHISVRTVESHVSSALRKLGASDRRALADIARSERKRQAGMLPGPTVPGYPLLGRDSELEELRTMLAAGSLVTVTGAGGSGKTRLAFEFARRHESGFPDGIVIVELAPLRQASLLVPAVAAVLGVKADDASDLLGVVADYLTLRQALVVLDNCEHVAAAAADLVDRLLSVGGALRVLTTSREPLRLRNEQVLHLRPLAIAAPGAPAAEIDTSPAVALFAERARAVEPAFRLTSDNRETVRQICARLDGLPLALELAAVRLGEISLADLGASIGRSLEILDGGFRDSADRHRALHATVDWSYQLLDPTQRILFERLSVFAGPFSLDAAGAVCGFDPLTRDVSPGLADLVAKSLVLRDDERYRLLEPVREAAADLLARRGARTAVADRHLEYFTRLARQQGLGVTTAATPEQLDVLRDAESNTRAALGWAFNGNRIWAAALGVQLVGGMMWRWFLDGHLEEGNMWAELALATTANDDVEARLIALYTRGGLTLGQADLATTVRVAEQMYRLAAEHGFEMYQAFAADLLGNARWGQGDLEAAREHLAESAAVAAKVGVHWHEAFALAELARVLHDIGHPTEARTSAQRALATATRVGEHMPIGFALDVLATLALADGAVERAHGLAEEALTHYRLIGYREGIASAGDLLARIAIARGDLGEAHRRLVEVVALHRQLGHRAGLAAAFEAAAQLADTRQDAERAALLLGASDVLRARIGAPVPPSDKGRVAEVRTRTAARLGDRFDSLFRQGATIPLDAGIALVRDALSGGPTAPVQSR